MAHPKKKTKAESAEVINLRRRRHNQQPIEWRDVYQVCGILQEEIMAYIQRGGKLNRLASKCNLNPNTISRIGSGETKQPRASTCLTLLWHFGYRVMID